MKLRFFSHSSFQITTSEGLILLIDPFLNDNPTSPVRAEEVSADFIILTHGHGDHIGDGFEIAKRTDPLFICVNELANYCIDKGFRAHNMHIGGAHQFDFGRLKFTIAHHGSGLPDGSYGGNPAGVLLTVGGKTVYHAGDTGLFYDMKLIGDEGVDLAILPIGDNFTMGPDDAHRAVELIRPKIVVPIHFDTFDVIQQDAQAWVDRAAKRFDVDARLMAPGDTVEL